MDPSTCTDMGNMLEYLPLVPIPRVWLVDMSHVQGLEARANMALGYVNHALLALWWSDSMCHHLGRLVWTPHGPCQSLKAICKGLKKERILVGVTNRQVVHHQTFW